MVLRTVSEMNRRGEGLGSFGAVLGATRDAPSFDLATLAGPYLVPGVGARKVQPRNTWRDSLNAAPRAPCL